MIYILALLFFILGSIWGSFLSVATKRAPIGRSHCPKCKKILQSSDLIPLLSFILLRGKCRYCKKPISLFYPGIELISGFTFLLVYMKFAPLLAEPRLQIAKMVIFLIITIALLFVLFYDLFKLEIPDYITYPGMILGFLLSFTPITEIGPLASIIGASAASLFFGGQILVSNGTWLGGGDLKLGIFMGFLLGWQLLIVALMAAYILGGISGLILIITKKATQKSGIPFGPFLVLGTFTAIFVGENIINWFVF